MKKIFTNSHAEMEQLLEKGYVVTSFSYFVPNGAPTYCLEKGSAWSKLLGSK